MLQNVIGEELEGYVSTTDLPDKVEQIIVRLAARGQIRMKWLFALDVLKVGMLQNVIGEELKGYLSTTDLPDKVEQIIVRSAAVGLIQMKWLLALKLVLGRIIQQRLSKQTYKVVCLLRTRLKTAGLNRWSFDRLRLVRALGLVQVLLNLVDQLAMQT